MFSVDVCSSWGVVLLCGLGVWVGVLLSLLCYFNVWLFLFWGICFGLVFGFSLVGDGFGEFVFG